MDDVTSIGTFKVVVVIVLVSPDCIFLMDVCPSNGDSGDLDCCCCCCLSVEKYVSLLKVISLRSLNRLGLEPLPVDPAENIN